jgi:hypothetical protein
MTDCQKMRLAAISNQNPCPFPGFCDFSITVESQERFVRNLKYVHKLIHSSFTVPNKNVSRRRHIIAFHFTEIYYRTWQCHSYYLATQRRDPGSIPDGKLIFVLDEVEWCGSSPLSPANHFTNCSTAPRDMLQH